MSLVRPLGMADIDAAVRIEETCFSHPWPANVYHATLLLPYAHYFAAVEDGQIVGTIGVQFLGGDGEISNVAVLPQYRRRGIAHELLEHVLRNTEGFGNGDYTLEVRKGNTAARALYESFGFVTEGVRNGFYTQPSDDALIMWRRKNKEI
jgi:ribosomal-protein-alanine acetyltransferase